MSDYSWEKLFELESSFGDAFYLLDLDKFKENYLEFLNAFRVIYSNTHIAYSYKTNYMPKLCNIVDELGGYAEVVSSLEYDLALKIGVLPDMIVFNGPYKRKQDIEKSLLAGSMVNLDSYYEVDFAEEILQDNPDKVGMVGLRLNFSIDGVPPSRFGFDIESERFSIMVERLKGIPNCEIVG